MSVKIHKHKGVQKIKEMAQSMQHMLQSLMSTRFSEGDAVKPLSLKRPLLPEQATRVEAAVQHLRKPTRAEKRRQMRSFRKADPDYKGLWERCIFIQGQMGTGKTFVAQAIAKALQQTRFQPLADGSYPNLNIFVGCPPNLVSTWEEQLALNLNDGDYNIVDLLRDRHLPTTGLNFCFLTYTDIQTHYTRDAHVVDTLLSEKGKKKLKKIDPEMLKDSKSFIREKFGRDFAFLPEEHARCPRCGNKIVKSRKEKKNREMDETGKVSESIEDVIVYYTVGEIKALADNDGPALICDAPKYQGTTRRWDTGTKTYINRKRTYWQSTPGRKDRLNLCGEVLVAPRRNRNYKPVTHLDPMLVDGKRRPLLTSDPLIAGRRKQKPIHVTPGVIKEALPHKAGYTNTASSVSSAYLVKKILKGQIPIHLAIMDEVHHIKSNGKRGRAGRWLMTAADQVIMLTGTLSGGKARDLFYLLWGLSYRELAQDGYGFNQVRRFCDKYGSRATKEIEVVTKKRGRSIKVKRTKTREIAGISASVYIDYFINRSIFLSLEDLSDSLAPYTEHRVFLRMSELMEAEYLKVDADFRQTIGAAMSAGVRDTSPLVSRFIHETLSWPDRLRKDVIEKKLEIKDKNGKVIGEFPVRIELGELIEKITPKDRWLIDHVKKARANGEKVLIYVNYVNRRDCQERIKKVLEDAGLRVADLRRGNPKSKDRLAWIRKHTPDNDCMICHPDLVKEGMNLLDYTQIVWIGPDYNVYRLRQANMRSRRIDQEKPVEVWHLGYTISEGVCTQEMAWMLIASKLESALIAEGNLFESALFDISYSPDSPLRQMIQAFIDGTDGALKCGPGTIVKVEETMDVENATPVLKTPSGHPLFTPSPEVFQPVVTVDDSGLVLVTEKVRVGKTVRAITRKVDASEVKAGSQLSMFDFGEDQAQSA